VDAASLIRLARDRAGLTQAQLADRSGLPRISIVRWENGVHEPKLSVLQQLVGACELQLDLSLSPHDASLTERTRAQLALAPEERLVSLLSRHDHAAATASLRLVADVLPAAILIGDLAAAVRGAAPQPAELSAEVVPTDQMLAFGDLVDAGLEPEEDARRYADLNRRWRWSEPRGIADRASLVVADALPGFASYRSLRRSAEPVEVAPGIVVPVAAPRDLLRIAESSSEDEHRAAVPALRALLDATAR
jgi:transcriptional regulator with XRE-family HTH domain